MPVAHSPHTRAVLSATRHHHGRVDAAAPTVPARETDAPGTGRSLGRTQKADVADRCANG
eukprot:scaffold1970_cov114-Isochrysis_galbana.AAC.9